MGVCESASRATDRTYVDRHGGVHTPRAIRLCTGKRKATFDEQRFTVFHPLLLIWDGPLSLVTVLPINPTGMPDLPLVPWDRILGRPGMRIAYQLHPNPYLSLLWIHTVLKHILRKKKEDHMRWLPAIIAQDQSGRVGYESYEVALIDALLPVNCNNEMPEIIHQFMQNRIVQCEQMQFGPPIPYKTSIVFQVTTIT